MNESPEYWALIAAVGLFAGALNAVAGGGTFFTFPVLLLTGMSPIVANATSKVGLWIGAIGSVRGFWPEIIQAKRYLPLLMGVSVAGSIAGSLLLLVISAERFSAMVPWLLLLATLSFTFGPTLRRWAGAHHCTEVRVGMATCTLQGMIGVYAGFFGAGIGIYMLALFRWMGLEDIHVMNGLKAACAVAAHTVSALILIAGGVVDWPLALLLMVSSFIGGYWGAYGAKKLPESTIRGFIILYGSLVTGYFFLAA